MSRDEPLPRFVIWALTVLGFAAIYVPPLYLLGVSLNPSLQPGLASPSEVTLKWYAALAGERALLSSFWHSLVIATGTAVLATLLSLLAALAYVELHTRRATWFLVVLLPMFVPGVIQGLALSTIMTRLGVKASGLTVMAGHLLWAMPFAFIVILTSFAVVRRSFLMAAADLGATRWQQFRDITLPLLRPGLVSAFIFSFLLSVNEFTRAFYLAGRQNTLPVVLFGKMNAGASPTIYAMSGAIFVVSVLCVGALTVRALVRRPQG